MVDYSKWDNIWISSDDDADCHPNIDKYAWRRLKQRMRDEKGESVNEPELIDKWNSTNINKKPDVIKQPQENPEVYIEECRSLIDEFSDITDKIKADGFLIANPRIVSQLTEGYLITKAVDLAVEDENNANIRLYAERCLQVHNINQSANAANIPPQTSVPLFYKQLKNQQKAQEYDREFSKQLQEILGRIETRREERLQEALANPPKPEMPEEVLEEAPVGPGGLHPQEVLDSLPEGIQQAFVTQDKEALMSEFEKLDKETANYHLQRCIDSGLWTSPNEPDQPEEKEQPEENEQPE